MSTIRHLQILVTDLGQCFLGLTGDVAKAAVFLASDETSFITGGVMCVRGDWHMHA